MTTNTRLRKIRWALLGVDDQLMSARRRLSTETPLNRMLLLIMLWLLQTSLNLVVNAFSLPIYLTGAPNEVFPLYARKQGESYTDSYTRFIRSAKITVAVAAVTIVALILAGLSAAYVRSHLGGM